MNKKLVEDLSKYVDLKVTSVHIDDNDNTKVWIAYKES